MTVDLTRPDLGHLTGPELAAIDAWWRACNYLTIGQIYLKENVLLSRPLRVDDIKPRLLGHWGTSPGLSFIYAHVSRLITLTGQEAIYLAGPGHGGPALVAAVSRTTTPVLATPKMTTTTPAPAAVVMTTVATPAPAAATTAQGRAWTTDVG